MIQKLSSWETVQTLPAFTWKVLKDTRKVGFLALFRPKWIKFELFLSGINQLFNVHQASKLNKCES